jgi:hypothetical protein
MAPAAFRASKIAIGSGTYPVINTGMALWTGWFAISDTDFLRRGI